MVPTLCDVAPCLSQSYHVLGHVFHFECALEICCASGQDRCAAIKKATWGTQHLSFESQEIVVQLQNRCVNIAFTQWKLNGCIPRWTDLQLDVHSLELEQINSDVRRSRKHAHHVREVWWTLDVPSTQQRLGLYRPIDYTNAESAFIGQAYLGYQSLDLMVWSCEWLTHSRLSHRLTTIEHVEDCDRVKGVCH